MSAQKTLPELAPWVGLDLSDANFDQVPYAGEPQLFYLLCTSPRCGSNFLCSLLSQTGLLGVPMEYLHGQRFAPLLAQRWGMREPPEQDLLEYFRLIKSNRTTPNGICGAKLHGYQLQELVQKRLLSPLIGQAKFIHLERRNLVAQAVSLTIAELTGAYSSLAQADPVELRYDAEHIMRSLVSLQRNKNIWQWFFSVNEIDPLVLLYENVMADPKVTVRRIADFVGVDLTDFTLGESLYGIQRTELNSEWEKRFKLENSGY